MNESASLTELADIVLPPEPQWTGVIVGAILFCMALLGIILWQWRQLRKSIDLEVVERNEALAELQKVAACWKTGDLNEREAAYRVSTILRLALGLEQLTAECPRSLSEHREEWKRTVQKLQQARYQPRSEPLSEATFDSVAQWIARDDHADKHTTC